MCAGERLRLAGFSAGTGVGAREGNGGAIRNSGRGSRSARRGRSDYDVLRSVHACCLPLSVKQDGLRYLAFLFLLWVGIANGAFSSVGAVIGLCGFTSGLRFFAVIPTELRPGLVMRKGAP